MLLLLAIMKKRRGCDNDDNAIRKEKLILTEYTSAGRWHMLYVDLLS